MPAIIQRNTEVVVKENCSYNKNHVYLINTMAALSSVLFELELIIISLIIFLKHFQQNEFETCSSHCCRNGGAAFQVTLLKYPVA